MNERQSLLLGDSRFLTLLLAHLRALDALHGITRVAVYQLVQERFTHDLGQLHMHLMNSIGRRPILLGHAQIGILDLLRIKVNHSRFSEEFHNTVDFMLVSLNSEVRYFA